VLEVPAVAIQEFTPEELETEEWRPVVDFELHYNVSNLGRVKRIKAAPGTLPGYIMIGSWDRDGYHKMGLRKADRRTPHSKKVADLVMAAFVGPKPEGFTVNHEDGNKANDRTWNLTYMTEPDNHKHAKDRGLMASGDRNGSRLYPERLKRGEDNANAKLTYERVYQIKLRLARGERRRFIAPDFNVTRGTISSIKAEHTWRHVVIKPEDI
jgi:hypothetical protein